MKIDSDYMSADGELEGSLEIRRDDTDVFVHSRSALVLKARGDLVGQAGEGAAALEIVEARAEVLLGFGLTKAIQLRDELTRLIDEWPD